MDGRTTLATWALLAGAACAQYFELVGSTQLEEPGLLRDLVVTGTGPRRVELLVEHAAPNPLGMGSVVRWRRASVERTGEDATVLDTNAPTLGRASPGVRSDDGVFVWDVAGGVAIGDGQDARVVAIEWAREPAADDTSRRVSVTIERLGPTRVLVAWHVVDSLGHHEPAFDVGGGVAVVATDTREVVASLRGAGAFGRWASPTADVDGDGLSDVLVFEGRPFDEPRPLDASGRVARVVSTASGDVLRAVDVTPSDLGGVLLTCRDVGDVDDDGTSDFALGVRRADFSGEVSLFDGATGERLDTRNGDGALGTRLVRIPDVDRDGLDDLVASAPGGPSRGVGRSSPIPPGRLVLLSSADLAVLAEVAQPAPMAGGGFGHAFDVFTDPRSGETFVAALANRRADEETWGVVSVFRVVRG